MNAAFVAKSFEIVKERDHEDGIRRFNHNEFYLDIHFLSHADYLVRWVSVVLLGLVMQAKVAEV